MESDFVAFAGGVNGVMGDRFDAGEQPVSYLHRIMPGFQPPKIRRAIIFELNAGDDFDFLLIHQNLNILVCL